MSDSTSQAQASLKVRAGIPPWNSLENYACCKASLEAEESAPQTPVAVREKKASEAYSRWLLEVSRQEGGWKSNFLRGMGTWTVEQSAQARYGNVYHHYKEVIKPFWTNVLNPACLHGLNSDLKIPSGMNEEDIIAGMKLYIFDAEQARKRKERARKKPPAAGVRTSGSTDGSAAVADGEEKENPPEYTQEIRSIGERGL
eukprot:6192579-Pleurochrysis_carterae.AAC.1